MTSVSWVRRAAKGLSRSRPLARWLLGVDFPPCPEGARYFDITTPVLVRAARAYLSRDSRLLDMGTGAFGSIGLSLWRRTGCQVVSTDIHPEIVRQARENVARNRAPNRVVEARFFEGVEGDFDCITFNIPYVPTRLLAAPGDFQSDGGPEGTSVIEAFLDAFVVRGSGARALLGVNRIFVPPEKFLPLAAARPDLAVEKTVRPPLWPVAVYVIRRREAATPA
ncbi:MAG TPA: methyltransferase [Vicinamibacteria bacterium]|nr:methyltransferase [Vicinamibacteria bacterium]